MVAEILSHDRKDFGVMEVDPLGSREMCQSLSQAYPPEML